MLLDIRCCEHVAERLRQGFLFITGAYQQGHWCALDEDEDGGVLSMCFLDECGESISIREVTVPEYCGNLAANLLDMISENASRQRNGLAEAYPYSAFEELAGEIDALAARFAVQEAELAEARSIAVSHDWELGGSLDFVNRKLNLKVELQPDLIGGIRVVVGDEVLDTSVKARLQQMKVALTA